ncbi:MAG: lysophospholipid acyltransferase family protein, partial [Acidimicrobiales bacterium]
MARINRLPFPLSKPQWPTSVQLNRKISKLGPNFETDWSRRYGVRLFRAVVLDNFVRPSVKFVASPEVFGEDRLIDLPTPVIFAANHSSHIDTPLLLSLLPDRYRHRCVVAAGADYFFDRRWKAYIWSGLLGAIPIERQKVNRRSGEVASKLLSEKWNLLIFPEGGRSPNGLGQEFKRGVAQLAVRSGRPVVPIYLEGTFEIYGKNSSKIKPGKSRVNFGKPLTVEDGEDPRSFGLRIQRSIDELASELHDDWWAAKLQRSSDSLPPLTPVGTSTWLHDWQRTANLPPKTTSRRWPRRFGSS